MLSSMFGAVQEKGQLANFTSSLDRRKADICNKLKASEATPRSDARNQHLSTRKQIWPVKDCKCVMSVMSYLYAAFLAIFYYCTACYCGALQRSLDPVNKLDVPWVVLTIPNLVGSK